MSKTQLQTKEIAYIVRYPEAIKFAELQEQVTWKASELDVTKDIQDMRVNRTPAEYHGIVTTLKLFTLYELAAGTDYWLGRFMRMFPRPADLQRMAAEFGKTELHIHAPFYNAINEALMLNTPEFYESYLNSPVLVERMNFIEDVINDKKDLVSLGAFSMVEGAILYSNFAYLKHFSVAGKNGLNTVVRGINFSVRDENLHSLGGAWAYRKLMTELEEAGYTDFTLVQSKLKKVGQTIVDHEDEIIDMIFSEGEVSGITADELKTFVRHRVNVCLGNLNIDPIFDVTWNPIADWFYENINMVQFSDFFVGVGNQYNSKHSQDKFIWPEVYNVSTV